MKSDFGDVSRACHCDGQGTGDQTCENLLWTRCVLARLKRAANRVSYRRVESISEANEEELALKAGSQTVEQSARSFFSRHSRDALEHRGVLGRLSRLDLLHLQSDFRSIKTNSEILGDHAGAGGHCKAARKVHCITLIS